MCAERNFCAAIDLGASGGRVAIGWTEENKLQTNIVHRFWNGPIPVRQALYWDALGLWKEILQGLKLGSAKAKEMGGQIISIGVDSWAVDFVLLDSQDHILDGLRCYRDPRTNGIMESLRAEHNELIYNTTGIQFLPFNSLYQLLATPPELLQNAKTLLMVPDLLHFWLTGKKYCERTNASSTQFFNTTKNIWAKDLLNTVKLPQHFLPNIIEPGSPIGHLENNLAKELDLEHAVVVAVGTHDTASAVAAVPANDQENWAYISSGTWSLVGVETKSPVINANTMAANFTNEAGVHGTNRLLKNVMGLWMLQECRRAWGEPNWHDLYGEAKNAQTVARIDPDDARYLAPGLDMPERLSQHCQGQNQTVPKTRGEITRVILESLAAKYAEVILELSKITSSKISTIHIVGGGSQVELLNQLTANATQCKVIAGPTDATLTGNMLLQLETTNSIAAHSGRQLVKNSNELKEYFPET